MFTLIREYLENYKDSNTIINETLNYIKFLLENEENGGIGCRYLLKANNIHMLLSDLYDSKNHSIQQKS